MKTFALFLKLTSTLKISKRNICGQEPFKLPDIISHIWHSAGLGMLLTYSLLKSIPEIGNQGATFDLPITPSFIFVCTQMSLLLYWANTYTECYLVPKHYGCFQFDCLQRGMWYSSWPKGAHNIWENETHKYC